jgi:hypothetical protein
MAQKRISWISKRWLGVFNVLRGTGIVFEGDRSPVTKRIVSGGLTVWKATKPLKKRSVEVDKIVICRRYSEENERLIASIRMIFPECEIQVLSSRMERYGDIPLSPEPVTLENGEKANGIYLDC